MRRLLTAALAVSILLCVFISNPEGLGAPSIRRPSLIINPILAGAPAAQSSANQRGAEPGAQERVSLEPGKPVERELTGGQS
ncbi:MAG TPA: hypothetical protein VI479_06695, partial [Blastocatellia bacterium]